MGGVGLASDGTKRGEIGGAQMDGVVATWSAVGKNLELSLVWAGWQAVLGATE